MEEKPDFTTTSTTHTTTTNNNGLKTVFLVLLCIFVAPIVIPLGLAIGMTVLTLIFSIFLTIVSLVIGFGAAAIGCFVLGIAAVMFGFVYLFHVPLAGFIILGAGLLVFSIGLLFLILTVLICGKLFPAVFRGITKVCGAPFQRKEIVV